MGSPATRQNLPPVIMYSCCAKTNVHYIRKVTSIVHFLKEYVFAGTYYENHEEFVSESSVKLNCLVFASLIHNCPCTVAPQIYCTETMQFHIVAKNGPISGRRH